jgi:hypothetical protein
MLFKTIKPIYRIALCSAFLASSLSIAIPDEETQALASPLISKLEDLNQSNNKDNSLVPPLIGCIVGGWASTGLFCMHNLVLTACANKDYFLNHQIPCIAGTAGTGFASVSALIFATATASTVASLTIKRIYDYLKK